MAHTLLDLGAPAPIEAEPAADQAELFAEAEPLFPVPVAHVAETLARSAGRGRPKGSANKRTTAMRDTLLRMGFRHPMMNLAAIANADPVELAAQLSQPYRPESGPRKGDLVEESITPGEAMALIVKANVELLPYFESKRPTEVHVEERSLGVLVVGDMAAERVADGVFSLTGVVAETEEDQ